MKQSTETAQFGTSDPSSMREIITKTSPRTLRTAARRLQIIPVVLQLGAMIGIAALVYPYAADWFATRQHHAEVSSYNQQVEQLPETLRRHQLQVAQEYNAQLPTGVLRDPYTHGLAEDTLRTDPAYQSYLDVLNISDNGVIGEVRYPRLDIDLPLYHGTSDEVLTKGVGHSYGSSLPIGGPSTHAVMTSHSGLVNASLFTDLPEAELGDIFTVTILGQKHYYEVRHVENVLPHETESLQLIDGQDWVTLITCTPIGVNSHRLLVQGQRVAPPTHEEGTMTHTATAGFPWWALIFLAGSAVAAYVIFSGPAQKNPGASQSARTPHTAGDTP